MRTIRIVNKTCVFEIAFSLARARKPPRALPTTLALALAIALAVVLLSPVKMNVMTPKLTATASFS